MLFWIIVDKKGDYMRKAYIVLLSSLVLCLGMTAQAVPGTPSDTVVSPDAPGQSVSSKGLDPTAEELAAARSVWQLMGDERYSYLIRSRDDRLASHVVDAYLNALDPERLVFLQSDIEKFKNKPMWSLAAMQGRALVAPLRIHEIYEKRLTQRMAWLDNWEPSVYPAGERWAVSRSQSPWPASVEAQDDAWQRYMVSIFLNSEAKEPAKKVVADQKARLKRAADVPRAEIMETFVNSFAQSIDPHAAYMLPASAENLEFQLSLALDGIGAVLTEKDGWVTIEEIRAGGPAAKDGTIKVGDKIIAIAQGSGDWVDAKGLRTQDAVGLIRGKSGTTVRLRIGKAGDEKHIQDVSLVRARIVMTESGAKEKIIEADGKKFGWLRLPIFYADWRKDGSASVSATKDVEAALERLKKQNVDGVILDLRDNGGGSLTEAVSLVGLFLPPSDVVQILGADEKLVQMRSERTQAAWTGPLVVLVNRGSASASEIAAAALQDHGRALVVGDKTFGKGTVQSVIDLDYLWGNDKPTLGQMKMTVAQFFRPSGRSTQLNGVVPDIVVPSTLGTREGEERYENAAPAAKIPPVDGLKVPEWKAEIPALQEYARQQLASSEDFQSWLKIQGGFVSFSERESYPLNASESARLKKSDTAWKNKMEAELKRLGLTDAQAPSDPIVEVTAEVAAQWLSTP